MAIKPRSETLFNLRYAERVLERQARFYARLEGLLSIGELVAGSAALAAFAGQHTPLTVMLGVFFAVMQAVKFVVAPARRQFEALASRNAYATIRAQQSRYDDAALEAAYLAASAADAVVVFETMRHLAYDDVVTEEGRDAGVRYNVSLLRRVTLLLA